MIYWYTGQPGHGKTLHAIDRAIEFKEQGRIVYVCNVRDFDYGKTGMLPMSPEQFRDWMNFLPEGAVALVDECYEHGMLPKRPNAAAVPMHVQELAKHRHRGLDFIFVCQSPDKQCDSFTHDLIERHIHVRRRYGTQLVHLREFDRFERNPEKAHPLVLKRVKLPKRPRGLYKSTELDTTERRIPWYFFALPVLLVAAALMWWFTFGSMAERMGGKAEVPAAKDASKASADGRGASATRNGGATKAPQTPHEYLAQYAPRVASQPWSAPAYDQLKVPSDPPRVFCMATGAGDDAQGQHQDGSCSCVSEQGTRYVMPQGTCRMIARQGQYEPLFDERQVRQGDGVQQGENNREYLRRLDRDRDPSGVAGDGDALPAGVIRSSAQMHAYGDIGVAPPQKIYGSM